MARGKNPAKNKGFHEIIEKRSSLMHCTFSDCFQVVDWNRMESSHCLTFSHM